jgi:hypothetical protein
MPQVFSDRNCDCVNVGSSPCSLSAEAQLAWTSKSTTSQFCCPCIMFVTSKRPPGLPTERPRPKLAPADSPRTRLRNDTLLAPIRALAPHSVVYGRRSCSAPPTRPACHERIRSAVYRPFTLADLVPGMCKCVLTVSYDISAGFVARRCNDHCPMHHACLSVKSSDAESHDSTRHVYRRSSASANPT